MEDTIDKIICQEAEQQDGGSASSGNGGKGGNFQRLTTHNVLASAEMGCPVDLEAACLAFWNCVYMPQEFQTTRVDIRSKTGGVICVSIFSNGKILATGGTTVNETKRALRKVARRLRDSPLTRCATTKLSNFEVANLLAVYNVGSQIRLNRLPRYLRGIDYEPERFPGAKIRVPIGAIKKKRIQSEKMTGDESSSRSSRSSPGSISGNDPEETTRSGGAWTTSSGSAVYTEKISAAAKKSEIVTVNIFSTGNLSFTGGRSIQSIRKAMDAVLPAVNCCLAKADL